MKRISTLLLLVITGHLSAGYLEGKAVFEAKCSSCHGKHTDVGLLKENFFEKENRLLKLTAPTVNMLEYALLRSPLHIGDPDDPEMQQIEIEEFLKGYLFAPNRDNSICDPHFLKYYEAKKSMKGDVSEEEIIELAAFFVAYRAEWRKKHPPIKKELTQAYGEKQLLADAAKTDNIILIEATSPSCYFCKKMKREVIEAEDVQKVLKHGFLYVEINMDTTRLPFGLGKAYKNITPSFFFVSKEGKLLSHYPGSWKKADFLTILKENRDKKE